MLPSWPAREQRHELPRRCCVAPCGKAPLDSNAPSMGSDGSDRSVSPSLTNLPVVVRVLPAGQMYRLRSLSNLKSSRLKIRSSRFDLSITGMCGAIFLSLTSQLRFAPDP